MPFAGGVFLVDTIGELAALYAVADVAFVGGSLVPQAADTTLSSRRSHGVAIVVGNHTENFRDIDRACFRARSRRARGGARRSLPLVLMELISNDTERRALGQRAAETLRAQAGATAKTFAALGKTAGSLA